MSLIDLRVAYGVGLAGNSRIGVLSRRCPDPGVDHFDNACLQSSSMAYGSIVLGVHGIHHIHEHHRRKVPTPI